MLLASKFSFFSLHWCLFRFAVRSVFAVFACVLRFARSLLSFVGWWVWVRGVLVFGSSLRVSVVFGAGDAGVPVVSSRVGGLFVFAGCGFAFGVFVLRLVFWGVGSCLRFVGWFAFRVLRVGGGAVGLLLRSWL